MSEIYFGEITSIKIRERAGKTYSDLMIDYAKKYGVINMWKWYCIDKVKFVKAI